MLKLVDLDKITAPLNPITSPEFFVGKTTNFHPDGLFSETIFGPVETPDRKKTFSYIELNCKILHPALFPVIRKLKRNILTAMSGEEKYRIENGDLVKDPNGDISGMTAVLKNFPKIDFRVGAKFREDLIKMIEFNRKNNLVFIDKCHVIPPEYRPIEIRETGEVTINAINDFYVKIIRLSVQLTSMSSGPVYDVLAFRMFQLVRELYDYYTSKVSKKTGILRGHMLGKRVDFTARAVISGSAAELRPDQIGVPFNILVKIFEPFIIHELLTGSATPKELVAAELEKYNGSKLSSLALRRLFMSMYKQDDITVELKNLLIDATNRAIVGKIVLAKRDPALHAESVQAFYPVLVPGNTIKIHPIKCSAFNADFDGDQMALYVPITRQAIEEAKEKLMVTISKDGMNKIGDSFDKDTAIGIFILTKEPRKKTRIVTVKDPNELLGMSVSDIIKYGSETTTVGRALFNNILPDGVKFINKPVNQKALNTLAHDIYNKLGQKVYVDFADQVTKLSFKYGTIASPSFGMKDLEVPKNILNAKEQIKGATPEEANRILDDVTKKLGEHLERTESNLGVLGEAGTLKGGYNQTRQILVAKGLIQDSEGNIMDPIESSYAEGFNSRDFFETGSGTRKGISDRVLNTADTGYLSRKLVYALQRVEADPRVLNCGTKKAFMVKMTSDIAKRCKGRYLLDKHGRPIPFDANDYVGKIIPLKSPLYCLSPKLCRTCYGDLLERNKTPYVGILSAQIFGERGTQLIMKTFHTGGAVSLSEIDIVKVISSQLETADAAKFAKMFKQKDSDLVSSVDGQLVIKFAEYLDHKKDIKITKDTIELGYGYFDIRVGNDVFSSTIDSITLINISGKKIQQSPEGIIVPFTKGNLISCPPATDAFHDKVKILNHLLSGKKPWKSADHFAMKLYDMYGPLTSTADFVHFEVLASQLLRDKSNPSYPARLNKTYNATIVSLKKIPALESWFGALMFEDPTMAVMTGLVYDREQKESVLEQIANGSL